MAGPDDLIAAVRIPAEPSATGAGLAAASEVGLASSTEAAAALVPAAAAVAPAPAAIELVAERPSLLETVGKDPAKPAEPKAAEPEKPAEAKPAEPEKSAPKAEDAKVEAKTDAKPAESEKAPLAPVEYSYTLPETLIVDDALRTQMHAAFDTFRADPAQGAQALIDLHNKVVTDRISQNAETTLRDQHKSFNDTRTQWNKDWAADEQIGGAGFQTALRAVARMRDAFVSAELPGTEKYDADRKSFEEFLRVTGAGDHPAFGRFLHNVARAFDEPALPPANPKPAPNNGVKPGSRRERMYDHPSSSKTS